MFGYVIANRNELSPAQLSRYRACYCGLCRALGGRFGAVGRMTLTYDMAFLVLLLSALYEPDEHSHEKRCAMHPIAAQPFIANKFTDYAADMNVLLAFYSAKDDWQDERTPSAALRSLLLRRAAKKASLRNLQKSLAIGRELRALSRLEAEAPDDLDGALNCFGRVMALVMVFDPTDYWSPTLGRMAEALGRFIYLMDAYEDLEGDIAHHRPNPLKAMAGSEGFDGQVHGMLVGHMGECALEFERLPIVEDADILRNILYSGVWTRHLALTTKKREAGNKRHD